MFRKFKETLSIDAKKKLGDVEAHEAIKVSGMTHIILDLVKKTSIKTLGCAPLMREVYTKCERSGTKIS